jgi:hypothetical protein
VPLTDATLIGREEHLTFKGNLRATRHGWLRLTPAYSVHLVADLVGALGPQDRVLDPFCGTGTTSLVCAEQGIDSETTDINPFLIWLSRTKAAVYDDAALAEFEHRASLVAETINANGRAPEWLPDLHQIDKWWDESTLHALGRAMATIRAGEQGDDDPAADLLRIAFCRVAIERASVSFGHQSMSFTKRHEQEALFDTEDLTSLVSDRWRAAVSSVRQSAASPIRATPRVLLCDARNLTTKVERASVTRVVTSPPYPNRMSYIRELRPYMYWLGYLSDGRAAGELDWQAIGGTWGCATSNVGKWAPTEDRTIPFSDLDEILSAIAERSELLSRYVHKYFFDMVQHVRELAAVMTPGASAYYIVGNSKFYDVLLPVEQIYAALFDAAGFEDVRVETIRKRSSKRELFEYVVSTTKPV